MNDRVGLLLARCERALAAGRRDLDAGDAESAADHAYYAMFYAASACLEREGLRFRKHSATHAAFGREFARSGRVDLLLHRWLLDAFDLRTHATYDMLSSVSTEDAETAVERAGRFRATVVRFLGVSDGEGNSGRTSDPNPQL
jgi:uncharacterized protein (UPF0332 family)